jgi:hypothetical protein
MPYPHPWIPAGVYTEQSECAGMTLKNLPYSLLTKEGKIRLKQREMVNTKILSF